MQNCQLIFCMPFVSSVWIRNWWNFSVCYVVLCCPKKQLEFYLMKLWSLAISNLWNMHGVCQLSAMLLFYRCTFTWHALFFAYTGTHVYCRTHEMACMSVSYPCSKYNTRSCKNHTNKYSNTSNTRQTQCTKSYTLQARGITATKSSKITKNRKNVNRKSPKEN